ncbi:copper homeostasis protein CutC [Agaribacter marinus]|uniref:Copper homeostasis protein cutC homolog n=1 Tax=Agaribacter marinus TaxID=1431249 RepID=A0AA37WHX4_9ALTE|nr:copper homeostasis protein CutC [Agaribacter marinus]GLR70413.1 copper homeostasis protein CutC [Agaribacter marinus]
MRNIEVCLDTTNARQFIENLSVAIDCGVKRFELCTNMHKDGLTPDMSTVESACNLIARQYSFSSANAPEIGVMIRLHNNNFTVTNKQLITMGTQLQNASDAGAQGVVFGVLDKHGTIDIDAMKYLCHEAKVHSLNIGIHRAFDVLKNSPERVTSLLELGVQRILSSGSSWLNKQEATMGLANLTDTLSRLPIGAQLVVAGGVNADNACIIESNLIKAARNTHQLWLHAYSGVLSNHKLCPILTRKLVNPLC